jgi:hypothetical protein
MSHAPSQAYSHRAKDAVPGPAARFGAALLKWYDLDERAYRITPQTRTLARAALQDFGAHLTDDCAGFAILHQCSASFAFLLISTWRGNNELWQSVHYIDTPLTTFAEFDPAYPKAPNLRPTFCVWELGIVAHEAQAWQRYLASDRSAEDFALWQSDCLRGTV